MAAWQHGKLELKEKVTKGKRHSLFRTLALSFTSLMVSLMVTVLVAVAVSLPRVLQALVWRPHTSYQYVAIALFNVQALTSSFAPSCLRRATDSTDYQLSREVKSWDDICTSHDKK